MAAISISISISFSSPSLLLRRNRFAPSTLPSLRSERAVTRCLRARDPALLRRPSISSPSPEEREPSVVSDEVAVEGRGRRSSGDLMDWEDMILQDTVPLVGFVRMILQSGEYESGDRLSPEHEKTIIERLLSYHPEYEKKIGCGIDYITIGFHPEFENSRCLFIVKKDGISVGRGTTE
ncbi:protein DCL, chloroplastic-like isoform X2 [Typha angustifolia]|uniref:protein DCL, chloroplastic-like isoform X2 n=1 Tax=Typha angustifolia TaxID=59011 RepID=UPI003C3041B2